MAKGDIETYYEGGQWKNRRQGNQRAFEVGDTKADVQASGRKAAIRDGAEHIIKKKDGTIGRSSDLPTQPGPSEDQGPGA